MKMDKEKKYDRQLRLWAAGGQSSLENSHICLINASTVGCETLKNLVLPGVGRFSIIDDGVVSDDDLSSNFFFKEQDVGKPKAEAACKNLNELNEDVEGFFVSDTLTSILKKEDVFWDQFSVVIVNKVFGTNFERLSDILWSKNIPLLSVGVVGFYGYLKLIAPEITVVETHPESLIDLRIDCPWKELKEYVDTIDLDSLDETDHAHIPYIVILIKCLEAWVFEEGSLPLTYADKSEFKKLLKSFGKGAENNIDEALSFAWRASQRTGIAEAIKEILDDPKAEHIDINTPLFWVYVKALRNFLKTDQSGGLLPLSGQLPDMASDTSNYIQLQIIYRSKAKADREVFVMEVKKILSDVGRPHDEVTESAAEIFCKNSRYLHVQRGSKENLNDFSSNLIRNDDPSFSIYLSFLAYNKFVVDMKRIPKINDSAKLGEVFLNFAEQFGVELPDLGENLKKCLEEMSSAEGSEIHNIASFMGGLCGQEALKLVTCQYRPLDNTLIYDGILSTTSRWKI